MFFLMSNSIYFGNLLNLMAKCNIICMMHHQILNCKNSARKPKNNNTTKKFGSLRFF